MSDHNCTVACVRMMDHFTLRQVRRSNRSGSAPPSNEKGRCRPLGGELPQQASRLKPALCSGVLGYMALSKMQAMNAKANGAHQANSPMENRNNGSSVVIADVVEQVAAQDQPGEDAGHDATRPSPPQTRPRSAHVHAPQKAKDPNRCECERSMQFEPPWFERMNLWAELSLFDKEVMKKEPQST